MPNLQYQTDRDGGFVGMESRTNPTLLKEQFLQYAQNIRLERGVAQARNGMKRMNNEDLDGLFIRGSAKFVTVSGEEKIAVITSDSLRTFNPSTNSFDLTAPFPTGRGISETDSLAVVQAVNRLYIFRGLPAHETPYFAKYDLPDNHTTLVTVTTYEDSARTTLKAHGYATGDEVTIAESADTVFNGNYIITRVDDNIFTYDLPSNHNSHTDNAVTQKAKPAFIFDGTEITVAPQTVLSGVSASLPSSDAAIYQGNRIILKQGRDKLAVSDYLDFTAWDLTFGQFTINLGSYDQLVGFTPWLENEFIIFQRNSIYKGRVINSSYVTGENPDQQSYLTSISNSFGCVGKRAIVNTGRFVFFLSDSGIYMLEPQLDLKTINTLEPLSSPINDQFADANRQFIDKAHGVFFDNRLFMAVPCGNDVDGNPHPRPNRVFVYNILNKAWESIDTYPKRAAGVAGSRDFYVDDFCIVNYGSRKRLFLVNNGGGLQTNTTSSSGGVFLTEEHIYGDETDNLGTPVLPFSLIEDDPSTAPIEYGAWLGESEVRVTPTDSRMITRRFTLGSLYEKRFSAVNTDMSLPYGGTILTTVKIINPDREILVDRHQTLPEPDTSRRVPIALRGYSAQVEYQMITGQPSVRGVTIDATLTGRNIVSKD
jgi:hypothetical protein